MKYRLLITNHIRRIHAFLFLHDTIVHTIQYHNMVRYAHKVVIAFEMHLFCINELHDSGLQVIHDSFHESRRFASSHCTMIEGQR